MNREVQQLKKETKVLRERLALAEEHLRAIRSGEVDALVVKGKEGEQVFTLKGADHAYRSIVEEMQEGAITVSDEGTILYSNKQFAMMLNIPLKNVIGSSIYDHLDSKNKKIVADLLKSNSREPGKAEVLFSRKAGKSGDALAYVSFRQMRIEDELLHSGVVTDITGLRMEKQNRLRLGAALEQALESVLLVDSNGRIQYANPATEEIFGVNNEQILGKSLNVISAFDGKDLIRKIQAELNDHENWKGRVCGTREDKTFCHLEVKATRILDEDRRGSCYVVSAFDVTEELELKKQIRHMQRMEAMGTLAGGIAHDLNNILQPIILSAEALLHESETDSKTYRMLERIVLAANRQKSLVQQILVFSRKEEKKQVVLLVLPLIKEAISFLRSTLPSTIEIRTKLLAKSDKVFGNPTEIHQVVMNLVSNAAEAIGSTPGSIIVTVDNVEYEARKDIDLKAGTYLRLAVSDDGCGISPEALDRVFDPFFTTKEEKQGTGLGLSVVHGIVRRQGGNIMVDSELGKGTQFNVYFPVTECTNVTTSDSETVSRQGHGTILLVDDEEMIIATLQNVLEKYGYQILSANDGNAALEIFRNSPKEIDLVITDHTMPRITGLELAEKLREINPEVRIILSTGYQENISQNDIRQAGIRAVLKKPANTTEVIETINNVLSY